MKRTVAFFMILLTLTGFFSCTSQKDETVEAFEGFRAVFLNTGKADCTIVQTEDYVLMCDTAESGDFNLIAAKLKSMGISTIDCLILTHFDKDHIGSAGAIIKSFDVKNVYAPDASADSKEYRLLGMALREKNMQLTTVKEDKETGGRDISVHIYPPLKDSYDDDNSYSLITSVVYKDKKLLLTGDADKTRLSEFVGTVPAEKYDVIKLPHHGEYTKPLLTLLTDADCRYGIVTCDANKSTVEKKLIKTAEKLGIELLYTYEGEVWLTCPDGELKMHR